MIIRLDKLSMNFNTLILKKKKQLLISEASVASNTEE